jgi:hypothetical protein
VSDESRKIIAEAAVALLYCWVALEHDFPVLAWLYDKIALYCGYLANLLADISMQARLNYFQVVTNG